jgi:hypothetical protein
VHVQTRTGPHLCLRVGAARPREEGSARGQLHLALRGEEAEGVRGLAAVALRRPRARRARCLCRGARARPLDVAEVRLDLHRRRKQWQQRVTTRESKREVLAAWHGEWRYMADGSVHWVQDASHGYRKAGDGGHNNLQGRIADAGRGRR